MLSYLKNRKTLKLDAENKISIKSPKSVDAFKINKIKTNEEIQRTNLKKNSNVGIDNKNFSKYQWILTGYIIIFLGVLSGIFFVEWGNIWQLPKSITFIFGVSGFLVLSSILWIFGLIKHSVKFGLGDIILIIWGITILSLSLLNPNIITFWGSSIRIFDSGVFIGFLILFYLLLKLFLESKFIKIIYLTVAILTLVAEIVTVILMYIPSILSKVSILNRLQPSNNWLTESPQELSFLSLVVFNIIFIVLSEINIKDKLYKPLSLIYYFSIFIHILILIRLPVYMMYILTIVALIVNTIIHINKLLKNNNSKNRLFVSRFSFGYGIVVILLLSLMIIRPFQNNNTFPEYTTLTIPNFNTSLSIAKQSIQSDIWFGKGNIMYAWNKFTPSISETQITDFSFETLYNEIFNLLVKNGLIPNIVFILFSIWIIGSIIRMLLIYRKLPIETYILVIFIVGLFLIPFTVITKTLLILVLVMWSNVFSKYFNPIIKLNLDINKIPYSISSLLTFSLLLSIAISVFVSIKFYNIIQSQEYIVRASQAQDNLIERMDLLKQASLKSPYIIDYTNLYIPLAIQQINQDAFELLTLSQQQLESQNIDVDKQIKLQGKINEVQDIIDQYKQNSPSDTRVIYWQLNLYSIVHTYGDIDENEYLSLINKGKNLQPNSLYWSLYEAKYYKIKAQKDKELNLESINQAKSIFNFVLGQNIFFVDAYQSYYDLLSINKEYKEQIDILNKYINATIEKNLVANQGLVYNLALAYQNDSQYDEAMTYYNKLLEAFPEYTNVYFKLGEIYEIEKNTDLAIQNYKKVLELDPNAEAARLKLEQIQ
jgi:tetratricopeptide (TPR) repeat protein